MGTLYKYCSLKTAEAILDRSAFRFTQPIALNDPNEFLWHVEIEELNTNVVKIYGEKKEVLIKEALNKSLEDFEASGEYAKLTQTQLEIILQIVKTRINYMFREQPDYLQYRLVADLFSLDEKLQIQIVKDIREILSYNLGVLCLSKNNDNLLMWSHYADAHNGIAIGIDASFIKTEMHGSILYSNQRARINFLDFNQSEIKDLKVLREKYFFTKAIQWNYEQEYRFYKPFKDCIDTGATDLNNFPILISEFPKEAIIEVCFGCMIDKKIRELFKEKYSQIYPDINYKQCAIKIDEYRLEMQDIIKP